MLEGKAEELRGDEAEEFFSEDNNIMVEIRDQRTSPDNTITIGNEHLHFNNDISFSLSDSLLKNPQQISLLDDKNGMAVDDEYSANHESFVKSDKQHMFCTPMMMNAMSDHDMSRRGVRRMIVGGDMSKGMIMYMDGFRFASIGNQPCLNLYFPSWTLDTPFKFLVCLVFVFLLSFATEGCSKFRHTMSLQWPRQQQSRRMRQIFISALHGVQALLGYVVMLATMTFSVEILLSVVLGLSCGYYYYFAGELGLEGHVTTNPCCSFLQSEGDDQAQRQPHPAQSIQQEDQQPQQQPMTSDENPMTANLLLNSSPDNIGNV